MFGIEEALKALLHEVKGMRHDLTTGLGALADEVKTVNRNLEDIRRDNQERLELLHPELKGKHGHGHHGSRH